jgi:hypothetical protein
MTQESQKLTAVEWLIEQMKNGSFESWHTKNKWNISYHAQEKTLEIAKAMEKEQIIKAFTKGELIAEDYFDNSQSYNATGKRYYNETYNK